MRLRRLLIALLFMAPTCWAQTPLYGTYFGKAGVQSNTGIVVNVSTGDYCTEGTTNDSSTFPVVSAFQATSGGAQDAFLSCINASTGAFRFSTYLGGSGAENGTKMVQDGSGNMYLTGFTTSTNFPVSAGSNCPSGSVCGFLAEFSSSGSRVFSVVPSGIAVSHQLFHPMSITLDGSGNIWIAGSTATTLSGTRHVLVAEFSSTGTLLQQTTLGGTATDEGETIAVSGSTVYIGGYTLSTDFPVTGGVLKTSCGLQCTETPPTGQCASAACGIGFLATLATSNLAVQAATYLGGTTPVKTNLDMEVVTSIALDTASPPHIYAVGTTSSTDFPTTGGAFQTVNNGSVGTNPTFGTAGCLGTYPGGLLRSGNFPCGDAFVAELNTALTTEVAGTYIGGSGMENAFKVRIDGSGNVWIFGVTQAGGSVTTKFPTTANAFQPNGVTGVSMFVTKFSSNLQGPLLYSTFYGNGPDQWAYEGDFTSTGNPVFGGLSNAAAPLSTWTSANAIQTTLQGTDDGFIAALALSSTQANTPVLSPFGPGPFSGSVSVTITDSTPSSIICYRTDGVTPASNEPGSLTCATGSTLYSGPVSISTNNTTLKAIGAAAGDTDSNVGFSTYTIVTGSGLSVVASGGAVLAGGAKIQ